MVTVVSVYLPTLEMVSFATKETLFLSASSLWKIPRRNPEFVIQSKQQVDRLFSESGFYFSSSGLSKSRPL